MKFSMKLREFTPQDWMAWAGAGQFHEKTDISVTLNGEEVGTTVTVRKDPLYGEVRDELGRAYAVIADGTSISVYPSEETGTRWEYTLGGAAGYTQDSARLVAEALPLPWQVPGAWMVC